MQLPKNRIFDGDKKPDDQSKICLNGSFENICGKVKVSSKKEDYYECGLTENCYLVQIESTIAGDHFSLKTDKTTHGKYVENLTTYICDFSMKVNDYGSIKVVGYLQKGVKICSADVEFAYCYTTSMQFGTCIQGKCMAKWDEIEDTPHFFLKFNKEEGEKMRNYDQLVEFENGNYHLYLKGNAAESNIQGYEIERKLEKMKILRN